MENIIKGNWNITEVHKQINSLTRSDVIRPRISGSASAQVIVCWQVILHNYLDLYCLIASWKFSGGISMKTSWAQSIHLFIFCNATSLTLSEWVIKFNGLIRTMYNEVHVVHIRHVIIAFTL